MLVLQFRSLSWNGIWNKEFGRISASKILSENRKFANLVYFVLFFLLYFAILIINGIMLSSWQPSSKIIKNKKKGKLLHNQWANIIFHSGPTHM